MTAFTFRLLGYIAIALGLAWTAFVLVGPASVGLSSAPPDFYAGLYLGRLFVVAPGAALVFLGLLMMAIGKALQLLDRIARNTAVGMDKVA